MNRRLRKMHRDRRDRPGRVRRRRSMRAAAAKRGREGRRDLGLRWATLRLASLDEVVRHLPRGATPDQIRHRIREHEQVLKTFEDTLGWDWAIWAAKPLPRSFDDCPKSRPCGHLLCVYHLALERTRHGSLRLVNPGKPLNQQETCMRDWLDKNPDGVSFAEVGRHFALRRTRMCQLWQGLVAKINATHMLPRPLPKRCFETRIPRVRPERTLEMAKAEDYVVPGDPDATLKAEDEKANPDLGPVYTTHPIARLLPILSGSDLEALVKDIKAHGQREPIRLYEGQILDGRNRYVACKRAGVKPAYADWRPQDGESAVDYVLSMNAHRRHLSESQRAMVAARTPEYYALEAQKRTTAPPAKPTRNCDAPAPAPSAKTPPQTAKPDIAHAIDLLKVSADSVRRAETVIKRGVPELAKAVDEDRIAVSAAAEVAAMPPSKQKRIMHSKDPKRAVRRVASRMRKRRQASTPVVSSGHAATVTCPQCGHTWAP